MAYKSCPDCGSRIFEYGCVNCNEEDYISMQGVYDTPEEKGNISNDVNKIEKFFAKENLPQEQQVVKEDVSSLDIVDEEKADEDKMWKEENNLKELVKESEDELWLLVADEFHNMDNTQKHINSLKKRFTIKRKI